MPEYVHHRYETPHGPRLLIGRYPSPWHARWAILKTAPRGKGRIATRLALRKERA